ncbi:MAG: ice-binding family protein [Bacteroidota bacterium]|nr:ice-binding family protein [Bacteroidota bacterium]
MKFIIWSFRISAALGAANHTKGLTLFQSFRAITLQHIHRYTDSPLRKKVYAIGIVTQLFINHSNRKNIMKNLSTNSTTVFSRWTQFVGASLRMGIIAALPLFLLVAGCKKDDTIISPAPVVIPVQTTVQAMVNLGSDSGFVILGGSLISNVPASAITGDIGLSPAARSFITGFGLTEVTGTIYAADDISPAGVPAMLTAAKGDLTTAYNDAAGRTSTDIVLLAGNLGGLTLTPGLYKSSGSLEISSGDLTFDAKGNANAVFIIQIASTLNTTSGRQIILSGGAKASNIFWQVGTSATLGTTSVFKGNIMADQSIALNTGAIVEGRLLARIAAVTLAGNTVVKPVQ